MNIRQLSAMIVPPSLLLFVASCGASPSDIRVASSRDVPPTSTSGEPLQEGISGPPLLTKPLAKTEPTVLLSGTTSDGEWELVASVGIYTESENELCVSLIYVSNGAGGSLCGLPHKDMDEVTVGEITFDQPGDGVASNNPNLIGVVTPAAHHVIVTNDRGQVEANTVGNSRFPGVEFFLVSLPMNSELSELKVLRADGAVIETRGKSELGR